MGHKRNRLRELGRIIMVVNPQSTNIYRIHKRGRELHALFPDKTITLVETSQQPNEMISKLEKELVGEPGPTLLCIGGGDGTVNTVVNALMKLSGKLDLAQIAVLPLWGGNANDFAYMLNGTATRSTMRSLLRGGRIVAVHPFEITLKSGRTAKTTRYAACYASFGASAYAAAELKKPARQKRASAKSLLVARAKEAVQVYHAVLDAPGFDAEQDSERIKIFEQAFANGPRMAKVGRLPVKLNEKRFYHAVKSREQPTFWAYLSLLVRGKHAGEVTDKTYRFKTKERAWAQFDGEAMVLPKNTAVTIGHAAVPFYALSTKLDAADKP